MSRLVLLLLAPLLLAGCLAPAAKVPAAPAPPPPPAAAAPDRLLAEINTPRGQIVCELFHRTMPLTVASFVGLAEGTLGPAPRKPFFDGLKFHRVVPGFVIQGGDPTGTGRGGPGYRFPDEFAEGLRHDGAGILSMANSGPDTNGSQFFITLGPARYLDYVHAIFGRVIRGVEVLPEIQPDDTMQIKIIREGKTAEAFRPDDASFAALLARASRWRPPHLEDRTSLNAGPPPWQARYIENRLANLARFTGRHLYVRIVERLPTESSDPAPAPGDAMQEMLTRLHAPPGSILVCFSLADDRWFLAGGPADLQLPAPKPPAEDTSRSQQSRIYSAAGEILSALIDQTDPK